MQKQNQEDGQVEEEVNLWKSEKQIGKYYDEDEEVKTETQLIDDFLNRGLVYEDEIDRNNKTITIGNRVINYGGDESIELDPDVDLEDDAGKEDFIAQITPLPEQITDEDGLPEEFTGKYVGFAPITPYRYIYDEFIQANHNFDIDWGDRTKEHIDNSYFENSGLDGYLMHGYDTPETYDIKITGECDSFMNGGETDIKVKQWGTTGVKSIMLVNCSEVAQPTKNSFKDLEYVKFLQGKMNSLPEYLFANCFNIKYFISTFEECTNLQEIPENIFANCINTEFFVQTFSNTAIKEIPENLFKDTIKAKSFMGTFADCTEITNIPLTLFDNCKNVENFQGTFNGCEKLTGEIPKLWLRGDNSETNNYEGENPYGHGCYGGCTKVNGYLDIPEHWRDSAWSI